MLLYRRIKEIRLIKVIEPRIEEPLIVYMTEEKGNCYEIDGELYGHQQVVFGVDHYGFKLVTTQNGELTERTYPTQCRVTALEFLAAGGVILYEEHKYPVRWQFSKDSTLQTVAKFSETWRPTVAFLAEQGVGHSAEAIDAHNQALLGALAADEPKLEV